MYWTYTVKQQVKKPRVAAYCRVSTEQEEQLGSFENQVTESEDYNALQKVRAKQMLELTAGGKTGKIQGEVPELTRMVLDRIEIEDPRHADVYFLDETVRSVELASMYDWE